MRGRNRTVEVKVDEGVIGRRVSVVLIFDPRHRFLGAWAILSKLGSREIPPMTMQFLFTTGTLPVALYLLIGRRFRLEKDPKGIFYSVANGIVSAIGILALFAAFRTGGSTAVIMVTTSLYPMVTVVLVLVFLRERLKKTHYIGLALAAAAIVLFSLIGPDPVTLPLSSRMATRR
jgi:uncharacterized membrane protein